MLNLLKIKKISPSQEEELKKIFTKKIDNLNPSITFLNKKQYIDIMKRCFERKIYISYKINVDYKKKK